MRDGRFGEQICGDGDGPLPLEHGLLLSKSKVTEVKKRTKRAREKIRHAPRRFTAARAEIRVGNLVAPDWMVGWTSTRHARQ